MACSRVRRDTGGSTPNASQQSRIRFLGCGPTQGMRALSMYSIGYDARVFSVTALRGPATSASGPHAGCLASCLGMLMTMHCAVTKGCTDHG